MITYKELTNFESATFLTWSFHYETLKKRDNK